MSNHVGAQGCVDFGSLPNPIPFYNSFTEFPSGSVLHEFDGVKMINYNDVSHPTNPTILDSIRDFGDPFGYSIYFKGRLTFDFSDYPEECKSLYLIVNTDSVFIDSYLYYLPDNDPLPFIIGDSIRVEADGGLRISGKFNTISFCRNLLSAPQSNISQFCLQT